MSNGRFETHFGRALGPGRSFPGQLGLEAWIGAIQWDASAIRVAVALHPLAGSSECVLFRETSGERLLTDAECRDRFQLAWKEVSSEIRWRLVLATHEVIVREVVLPKSGRGKIIKAVRLRRDLDFPPPAAAWIFADRIIERDETHVRVRTHAASRSVVASRTEHLKDLGIEVKEVVLAEDAIRSLFDFAPRKARPNWAVLEETAGWVAISASEKDAVWRWPGGGAAPIPASSAVTSPPGLPEALRAELVSISTRWSSWSSLGLPSLNAPLEHGSQAETVAASLCKPKRLVPLGDETHPRRIRISRTSSVRFLQVILLSAVVFIAGARLVERRAADSLRTIREHLEATQNQVDRIRDLRAMQSADAAADSRSDAFGRCQAITALVPPGVTLTELAVLSNERLVLTGTGGSVSPILEFSGQLETLPWVVHLESQFHNNSGAGSDLVNFELRAQLEPATRGCE